ncbi:aspartate:alanine exchanger family transporter [Maribellus maritimus]|uniref:aspartate:alanine exchanger family transporter n=1 Tax=Maribellus maritimus TaxID=2870838 RepID=UPI001EECC1BA|nr:TrkA C-terminal domain-containing protein [Maribellus maritimus]MCG6188239.1 transporter [Maribellus maritimus]
MELLSNSYFALFLIVALGFILGRIKIFGLSLDVSAVIFIALIFGHYGIVIPKDFQNLGLVLFIFTIGIQAGPGFFESFKKEGRQLASFATVLIVIAAAFTVLIVSVFKIDKNIAIGLLTGALTSTPGLAAAIDYTNSPLASIGYGVGYPFGVIGVILFIRFLPKILNISLKKSEEEFNSKIKEEFPEINRRNFFVENENIVGKTIGELRIRFMTKAVVSRVVHEGIAVTPTPETILHKGDLIKAVGTEEALKNVELLIGQPTEEEIPLDPKYDVRGVLVTNKEVVNKTIGQINLLYTYNATITRIRRSGINISPSPGSKLQFGDKLIIASSKANMEMVAKIFGDDQKRLSDTDILPVALGIILGVLVGKIGLNMGSFSFSLGLTGGVLVIALALSRIGKTGPVIWTMSGAANQLLRQFGLILFLAAVGSDAGAEIVKTFNEYGIQLFLFGGIITLFPMIIAALVGKWFFKMNVLSLLGAISGSMTSTPGLAAADSMTETNAHSIAYATVYPVAMVLLIVVVQLISLLL